MDWNTPVLLAKTTSSTSKTTTKDSDGVSTVMMTISIHSQLVTDVNAMELLSTSPMITTTKQLVDVPLIIISLMDIVPLVEHTVPTVTNTDVLSVNSDTGSITPEPYVSTSVQPVQYTMQPQTVEHV